MPPRITWSHLLPGSIALGAVIAVAAGAIVFGGAASRGEDSRLYVLTDQAQGVMGGTEVWLVGQRIGTVERIEFRPPDADTSMRVVLVLSLNSEGAEQIRHDSRAQIRTGGSVIGPAIVYISGGTPGSAAAADGDTLRAQRQSDAMAAGTKLLSTVTDELGPLMADARTVIARARRRSQTVRGSLTEQHDGEVALLRGGVARLRDLFDGTRGARDVMEQARIALARADSIRALLNSPSASLGRFRRDATLDRSITALREDLSRVRARLDSGEGSLGRLARDSAMTRAIANAQREMTLLSDDVKRRPGRYIIF